MAVLPLIMTPQGLQPQPPKSLRDQLVAAVAATNKDYTANLPGGLIEDVASTDVAACVQSDSFLVDLVNSISPNGANPFLLQQFGELYGITPQSAANTSIYVIFYGPPGFVIVRGFMVSDGSFNYLVQDGGVIGSDGQSLPLYAVSNTAGSWAVPAGSVTQYKTSIPASVAATFGLTNPVDGVPATAVETMSDYHDRVMTAGLAASTGMSRYMKTLLADIPGVQMRLVSARQDRATGRYVALAGGGDPYQVAYGLYKAMFWLPGFIAPQIEIVDVSLSNPAVITTANNHNLVTGMNETFDLIEGTGTVPALNGRTLPVTVIADRVFSVPFDTTPPGSGYRAGGIVTPNPIVQEITITDYPDVYLVTFVTPAEEVVDIVVTWETDSPNYVSPNAVQAAVGKPLQDYINTLPVGTAPINVYDMTAIFLESIEGLMPRESVTVLNFAVSINNVGAAPDPGTGVIFGDPNSYFYVELNDILVEEGDTAPYKKARR